MASPNLRPRDKSPTHLIESPSGSEDRSWFRNFQASLVNKIHGVMRGSSSPSVTFNVFFDTDRTAVGTALFTVNQVLTNTTTGVDYVPDVATIPADRHVWIETFAQSGTVLEMSLTMDRTP